MFGGGLCFFQPMSVVGSCRKDDLDLLNWAKERGWRVGTDRGAFDNLTESVA